MARATETFEKETDIDVYDLRKEEVDLLVIAVDHTGRSLCYVVFLVRKRKVGSNWTHGWH